MIRLCAKAQKEGYYLYFDNNKQLWILKPPFKQSISVAEEYEIMKFFTFQSSKKKFKDLDALIEYIKKDYINHYESIHGKSFYSNIENNLLKVDTSIIIDLLKLSNEKFLEDKKIKPCIKIINLAIESIKNSKNQTEIASIIQNIEIFYNEFEDFLKYPINSHLINNYVFSLEGSNSLESILRGILTHLEFLSKYNKFNPNSIYNVLVYALNTSKSLDSIFVLEIYEFITKNFENSEKLNDELKQIYTYYNLDKIQKEKKTISKLISKHTNKKAMPREKKIAIRPDLIRNVGHKSDLAVSSLKVRRSGTSIARYNGTTVYHSPLKHKGRKLSRSVSRSKHIRKNFHGMLENDTSGRKKVRNVSNFKSIKSEGEGFHDERKKVKRI